MDLPISPKEGKQRNPCGHDCLHGGIRIKNSRVAVQRWMTWQLATRLSPASLIKFFRLFGIPRKCFQILPSSLLPCTKNRIYWQKLGATGQKKSEDLPDYKGTAVLRIYIFQPPSKLKCRHWRYQQLITITILNNLQETYSFGPHSTCLWETGTATPQPPSCSRILWAKHNLLDKSVVQQQTTEAYNSKEVVVSCCSQLFVGRKNDLLGDNGLCSPKAWVSAWYSHHWATPAFVHQNWFLHPCGFRVTTLKET